MSEAYNPETELFAKLETLELDARQLAQKRDQAKTPEDRQVLERQLKEVEDQVAVLKSKLKGSI